MSSTFVSVSEAPVRFTVGDISVDTAPIKNELVFSVIRGGSRFEFVTPNPRVYDFDFPRTDACSRAGVTVTAIVAVDRALIRPEDNVSFPVNGTAITMSGATYAKIGFKRLVAATSYSTVSVFSMVDGSRFALDCNVSGVRYGGQLDRISSACPRATEPPRPDMRYDALSACVAGEVDTTVAASIVGHVNGIAAALKPEARRDFEDFIAKMRSSGAIVEAPRVGVVEFVTPDEVSSRLFEKFAAAHDFSEAANRAFTNFSVLSSLLGASVWREKHTKAAAFFEQKDRSEEAWREHAVKLASTKTVLTKAFSDGAVAGAMFVPSHSAKHMAKVITDGLERVSAHAPEVAALAVELRDALILGEKEIVRVAAE